MVTLTSSPLAIILIWLPISNLEYIPPGPQYQCPKETERHLLHPCVCENGTDSGLFVRCENSGLAVLSVGLGNLAGLGLPVEKLVLKECQIAHLFGPLFHRSIIRVLIIEDTPLKSIEQYAFAGVNRTLQELHLINTKIEEFPKEAFKILGNLTLLNINGHNMKRLDKDIFAGSEMAGRIEKLYLVNGFIEDLPVEPFQHLKKLKTLDLHGNRITKLQRNQFKGLRDTEVLDLSYNNLTKLDGSHISDLTKLGWCNASHNNIGDIPRGMFARNTLLKVLHLDNNKIKKLDTNSFRGMRLLRRLFLQDNMISDIGRGTFGSVTRIGTVDLARNRITKVDYQMFNEVKYAEIINLAENQIKTIDKQAFTYLYAATVNISHNGLIDIEAGAFENCNNLTVLDLSYNNLTEIRKNAFDENTYPSELQVSYNRFTNFGQIPIQYMTGLRVLNASHNAIDTIPKAAFPKLYELHTIDLSHNKLYDIANGVFQNLFSLRYLNLSHNSMEQIKPSTFGTVHTVLELDLSHNKLVSASRGGLANLASCRVLDISHNYLDKIFQIPISLGELNFAHNNVTEIPANTWPVMNALLRLNLSSNQLGDRLGSDSFRGLITLQKLDLSNNGVNRPPWEALSGLNSLQYLYLQNNNLTSLSRTAFGNLPTIFEIDLTNNGLNEISKNAFQGMLQLVTLYLSHNNLEHIPNEAFKGLVALRTLDLSHNLLEKIDNRTHGLLDDCLSLETINLSHNQISILTKKMFPQNQYIPYRLYNVDLSYNSIPVLTYDLTYGTKKVKKLNLSNNHINDIRNNVLGNLTSLQILDLSKNKLRDVNSILASETKLELPADISEIDLSDNILQMLPIEKLVNAKHLNVLNLKNNELIGFDPKLVKKIKDQGLQVYFEGNNLNCDCFIRPIKHYMNHLKPSLRRVDEKYNNLICKQPKALQDENLLDIIEDRLICTGNIEVDDKKAEYGNTDGEMSFDFVSEPDLAFRDIQFSQPSIYVHWFVFTTQDVADFSIFIRDKKNTVFYSKDVFYNQRFLTITIDGALKAAIQDGGLELCVQAKSSENFARRWYENQCKSIPNNFDYWPKKLNLDKRRLNKKTRKFVPNNVLNLVNDSILITFCIFLGVCFRKLSEF